MFRSAVVLTLIATSTASVGLTTAFADELGVDRSAFSSDVEFGTTLQSRRFTPFPRIMVDGQAYFLNGFPEGPSGELAIPGHEWVRVGPNKWLGTHVNTGPLGAPQWWTSNAEDGALLWVVQLFVQDWNKVSAIQNYIRGFVSYQPLVSVEDGTFHPTTVAWFKHVAVRDFVFDGGILTGSGTAIPVTEGVDYRFLPNWNTPFDPETWDFNPPLPTALP